MRWIFGFVVLIEVAAIAVALRLVPAVQNPDNAVFVVAINTLVLIALGKRLKKKPACCS